MLLGLIGFVIFIVSFVGTTALTVWFVVRLPADVSRGVLVAVVRVVGSLRPWKAPQS